MHHREAEGDRWLAASHVQPVDHLTALEASTTTVTGTLAWTQNAWMYDLTINTTHTFYILASGGTTLLLVHNCQAGDLNTSQARRGIASHIGAGTASGLKVCRVGIN